MSRVEAMSGRQATIRRRWAADACAGAYGGLGSLAMATAIDLDRAASDLASRSAFGDAAEQRFLLPRVPWWMYVAMRDALGDDGGTRMTFLEGKLELMSPSTLHEDVKKLLARLLEAWATELDVDLRGFGNATFRREVKQRGLEPDECYTLGPLEPGGVPLIAIEVEISSPLLDKLEVYAGLGIAEVWAWRGRVVVHRLVAGRYEEQQRSEALPALDLGLMTRFVRPGESQTALTKAYLAALREAG
jgi:Uma2 family endonuclease